MFHSYLLQFKYLIWLNFLDSVTDDFSDVITRAKDNGLVKVMYQFQQRKQQIVFSLSCIIDANYSFKTRIFIR